MTMANGSALPAWLTFDSMTRTFNGIPTATGTVSIKVTAKDTGNLSASDIFDLAVNIPGLTLTGTEGSDNLNGGAYDDTLFGLGGDDRLYGDSGRDTLDGGQGNDTLFGGVGDDLIKGGLGDDTLNGDFGNDTLEGGVGNDNLYGGLGNDIFEINAGDGNDTIIETGGDHDILRFKDGMAAADVTISRYDDDLNLTYKNNQYINIVGYFASSDSTNRIDRIEFSDGTAWAYDDIKSRALVPTQGNDSLLGYADDDVIDGLGGNDAINGKAGNDLLKGGAGDDDIQGGLGNDTVEGGAGNDRLLGYGYSPTDPGVKDEIGDDTLYGGTGNDWLMGGNGADTYLFGRGDGFDLISDGVSNAETGNLNDTLRLGVGVLPGDVTLYQGYPYNTLVINGSHSQIGFYDNCIERIEFDNGLAPFG